MQQVHPEDLVIIDIETVSEKAHFGLLDPAWQTLWQKKVQHILPEGVSPAEFYLQRAGVMAEFAKIICISIGYFINEHELHLKVRSYYGHDEKKLLLEFCETMKRINDNNRQCCFAGHNVKEFDIPFICRRLLINRLPLPVFMDFQNMKPWETNIVDSFQYWRFGDYKNFTSLDLMAHALDISSSKDDMDGSQVGELYWQENQPDKEENLLRIVNYCQNDVITTGNIILRLKNMPLVHPDDIIIQA